MKPGRVSRGSQGWLMTAVAPWGENAEDAYDQGLVELGLGDTRLTVSYTHLTLPTTD